jgi:DNA polymerase (family 10)
MALHRRLHVDTLAQLREAADAGRIDQVRGFGARAQQRIVDALRAEQSKKRRFGLVAAERDAEALSQFCASLPGTRRLAVAGSLRRRRDSVADLDVVISSSHPAQLMRQLPRFEAVAQVLAQGRTRASVVLRDAMQVDVRVVAEASFGAALHYFTGSKAHNIALRALARQRGWKLNEYGLFSGASRIAGASEAEVFAALELPYIVPELRENRGEIAAAQQRRLPVLVERADLRGDLHAHTSASDGRAGLREMALAARRCGLSYLAITDHSRRLGVARGLDADRLARQIDEIDRLNAQLQGIVLLRGIEVDIHEDGRLDMPDALLRRLDVVLGAVHSQFGLPRQRQTERILRAMEHPCLTLLAHPSGRLILERDGYDVDLPRLIRHARQRACFLELNAQPSRLDLDDNHCRMAKDEGVLVSINSDAHSPLEFDNLRFGVGQARRDWLERGDVLNARPLAQLAPLLARARGACAR